MSIATSFTPSKSLLSNWVVEFLEGLLAAPIAHVYHVPLCVTDHRYVLAAFLKQCLVHPDQLRQPHFASVQPASHRMCHPPVDLVPAAPQ